MRIVFLVILMVSSQAMATNPLVKCLFLLNEPVVNSTFVPISVEKEIELESSPVGVRPQAVAVGPLTVNVGQTTNFTLSVENGAGKRIYSGLWQGLDAVAPFSFAGGQGFTGLIYIPLESNERALVLQMTCAYRS